MRWKARNIDDWHPVFAWFPVDIDGYVYWLEPVERRRTFCTEVGDDYEYRVPAS